MALRAIPKRFVVVGLTVLAAFICYIDRVNISVAIISMQHEFAWSDTTKGLVLSSFFIGYVLFQIPSGWLADRFGGKWLLASALVVWSLMTLLTPIAASASLAALLGVRIVMGAGEAGAFPAAYNLFGRWVPKPERARSIAALLSGLPLGTLFALAATGPAISIYGWEGVFFLFGAAGIIFAIPWLALIHQEPERHPTISQAELEAINASRESPNAVESSRIPYREIFTNAPVWALIINHFCSNWIFYVLLSWLPSYFHDQLGVSVTSAGLFSIGPWVTMFVMTNVAAWLADAMVKAGTSVTRVRKIMQLVGLMGAALFLLLVRGAHDAWNAVFLICGALGMLAFTWSGFATNHLDIAPRHAGFLLGLTNTAGSLPGVVGVVITGWLRETTGSYDATFLLAAGVCAFGALVWAIFASGERQF